MKSHTSDFKSQLTELGRELRGVITYENITLEEEIMSITPHYEANLLKSVMKQLDLELTVDIPLNTVINCQIGILVNGNYEMLNFGNYVVYKSEKQEDTNTYKLTCYDKMLYAMKENEDLGVTYPISISAYLVALANKIGLSVETQTFYNSSLTIPSELYLGQNYTYRDILDEIAQATGSVICINDNDNLEVRYPNDLGAEVTATGKDITITEHEDNKISAFKIYGSSEQETTEGKNKFRTLQTKTLTTNGITFTLNKDKTSVIANGTATENAYFPLNNVEPFLKKEVLHSLSCVSNNGTKTSSSTFRAQVAFVKPAGTYYMLSDTNNTYTPDGTETSYHFALIIPKGMTCNNLVLYPQLEEGNVSSYEPYTGRTSLSKSIISK